MANLREHVINATNSLRQRLLQAVDRLEGSPNPSSTCIPSSTSCAPPTASRVSYIVLYIEKFLRGPI